jgi:5-deoxy-glucuronate isomerase
MEIVRMDKKNDFLFRPTPVPAGQSGTLLSVTPEAAGWKTIGFSVHRLAKGDIWRDSTGDHEVAIVVLGGKLTIDWGEGPQSIGGRENVFAGYPSVVYLPCDIAYQVRAESLVEIAVSRIRSQMKLSPRLFTPADLDCEIRGGGNTTRQITRIIRPESKADKLMMNEVYTPGGNWSSYPPHKHDCRNPPKESDLDELYYFRMDHPDGFALFRQYDGMGTHDAAVTIRDGDLVILRDGYHLVAAAPGYKVYYLAVLAGAERSLAASTDPRYDHLRNAREAPDPRVPLVNCGY